jgi:hypothetical protein
VGQLRNFRPGMPPKARVRAMCEAFTGREFRLVEPRREGVPSRHPGPVGLVARFNFEDSESVFRNGVDRKGAADVSCRTTLLFSFRRRADS